MLITDTQNPVRVYRQINRLTQVALAKQANVTPQIILRVEQGLFTTIPVNLLDTIAHSPEAQIEMLRRYQQFVVAERHSHSIPPAVVGEQNGVPILTFKNLKEYLGSTTAIARLLLIQISMVQEYEKSEGHKNVGAFRTALSDLGFKGRFTYA